MKKLLYFLLILTILIFTNVAPVSASLLVIKKDGSVVMNVLASEDETTLGVPQHGSLQIDKAGSAEIAGKSSIALNKTDNKVNLTVSAGDKTNNLDVTNWKENIIEIEERPEVQKLSIRLSDGKFSLKQRGITATTDLSLLIDSGTSELSLGTLSGKKYLSVLPFEATQSVLRTKLVNKISEDKLEIIEKGGDLAYKIPGERVIDFFGFYSYSIPITSYISSSTGAVLSIDGPKWINVINFIFS